MISAVVCCCSLNRFCSSIELVIEDTGQHSPLLATTMSPVIWLCSLSSTGCTNANYHCRECFAIDMWWQHYIDFWWSPTDQFLLFSVLLCPVQATYQTVANHPCKAEGTALHSMTAAIVCLTDRSSFSFLLSLFSPSLSSSSSSSADHAESHLWSTCHRRTCPPPLQSWSIRHGRTAPASSASAAFIGTVRDWTQQVLCSGKCFSLFSLLLFIVFVIACKLTNHRVVSVCVLFLSGHTLPISVRTVCVFSFLHTNHHHLKLRWDDSLLFGAKLKLLPPPEACFCFFFI